MKNDIILKTYSFNFKCNDITDDNWNWFLNVINKWGDPIVDIRSESKGTLDLQLNSESVDKVELLNMLNSILFKSTDNKHIISKNAGVELFTDKKSRELPINLTKDITISCGYVFRISVILSNENFYPWYYENFIELVLNPWTIKANYIVNYKDILEELIFGTDMINSDEDIIAYIRNKIDEGYYAILLYDEYYIPNKNCYMKRHFVHEVLVYGYDDFECTMQTISLYGYQGYLKVSIDYTIFNEAYIKGRLFNNNNLLSKRIVILLKKKDVDIYEFNLKKYITSLDNYINSVNRLALENPEAYNTLNEHQKQTRRYGLEISDVIINYLNHKYEDSRDVHYLTFLSIDEHKKCIYRGLNYIKSNYLNFVDFDFSLRQYNDIVQDIDLLKRKYIKQSIKENKDGIVEDQRFIQYAITTLKSAKQREWAILSQVITELKNNCLSQNIM